MTDRNIEIVLNSRNATSHVVCAHARSRGIERRVPRFDRHRVALGQGDRTGLRATSSLEQPVTAPRKPGASASSNPCREPLSGVQKVCAGFAELAAAAHIQHSKATP